MSKESEPEQHELGHELRDVLSSTVNAFIALHEGQGNRVSLPAILLALEMEASVVRRLCRDMGITKAQIKDLQKSASNCASAIYEELTFGEEPPEDDPPLN